MQGINNQDILKAINFLNNKKYNIGKSFLQKLLEKDIKISIDDEFFIKQCDEFIKNKDIASAEILYGFAIKNNKSSLLYHSYAIFLKNNGRISESIEHFSEALKIDPGNFGFYRDLGLALKESGKIRDAIMVFQNAIKQFPRKEDLYFYLGQTLFQINKIPAALKCFNLALQIKPDFFESILATAIAYDKMDNFHQAIKYYNKALAINPGFSEVYNSLGLLLRKNGFYEEAENKFLTGLEKDKQNLRLYNSLGNILKLQGKFKEAEKQFDNALRLDKNFIEAKFSKSLLDLLKGDFKNGWKGYENRWNMAPLIKQKKDEKKWQGQSFSGKTLLVWCEQGMGDSIQFIRYCHKIKLLGGIVILQCPGALKKLFRFVAGIDKIIDQKEDFFDYDFQISLMSLPFIFQSEIDTIPNQSEYIHVPEKDVNLINQKLSIDKNTLNIGIVWAGNPKLKNDLKRSISLNYFTKLLNIDQTNFYSLQKGDRIGDLNKFSYRNIKNLDDQINDFFDTALIIKNLDVIITVDTSVAHLAGALGKRVWTLLPLSPDWRWLLNRNDSIWYPTMRLYRQKDINHWENVFSEINHDLRKLIKEKKHKYQM